MRRLSTLLALVVLCTITLQAQVANNVQVVIEGKVVKVADGDTITVLDKDNKQHRIRFQGIDAPESSQAFGQVSKKNLSDLIFGKQVTVIYSKMDKYRRVVGKVLLDGKDINIEQIRAGLAWHYKKYADEQPPEDRITYAQAETEARAARRGLWQDPNSTPPGDYRADVKSKRWGPPPPEGTIIGNKQSKKYHRPDCPGYRDMAERNRVFFRTVEEAEAAGYTRAGNCPAEIQATIASSTNVSLTTTTATTKKPATSTQSDTTQATTQVNTQANSTQQRSTTQATTTSNASTTVTQTSAQVRGNKNSKIYHLPGCSGYDKVSEKNLIVFNSTAEAEAAGYRIAKNCQPSSTSTTNTSSTTVATTTEVTKPTKPATETTTSTTNTTQHIVGNKNSKIYHFKGCAGYDKVSEKNRVFFNTAAEAESAGYTLAKNCQPSASTSTSTSSTTTTVTRSTEVSTPTKPTADLAATTNNAEKIIGNKNSKIYHKPGCAGYDKVSEKNRVYFNSTAEAEAAGYRVAKNCP